VELLSVVGGVATIAGGLLFATIWRSYVTFYAHFGLQPADVGLTHGDVIRTAAVGLLMFLALVAPFAAVAWLFVFLVLRPRPRLRLILRRFLRRRVSLPLHLLDSLTDVQRRNRQLTGTAFLLILLAPLLSLGLNNFIQRRPYLDFALVAVVALLCAVTYCGVIQQPRWRATVQSIGIWAAAIGIVFWCAFLFLDARAERLAIDILEDGRAEDTTFVFQVRRDVVCVAVEGEEHRYLFLGESSHGLVLFDPSTGQARRLAEATEVVFVPRGDCACC
jgi:hypothetical protein